ncbi:FecR family protein [Chitinophaga varians]|uniref:FecR family protein n=1 Tax=Chitinophaga varians TaxID=2202339 RepID=UPI00165F013A|nr:FecR family protein [Chitinophaga varians]MBC9914400.1 FecR domain-containing protein [Chitinophaga varians]
MHERLLYLFDQYYRKTISPEEKEELFTLMADPSLEEPLKALILESYSRGEKDMMPAAASAAVLQAILGTPTVVRRSFPLRRAIAIAAAVAIVVAVGAWWLWRPHVVVPVTAKKSIPVARPKKEAEGAMLTLADGRRISLDSLMNGAVATDGGADIAFKDGQLSYNGAGKKADPNAFNVIHTPRGKQFHVVLADGTRVWLNAATTLRYPAMFAKERVVEVTGEAYFEAAQQATAPFRVIVPGQATIQVLGTHFNVNAYPEGGSVKTTLLHGAVRVAAAAAPDASVVLSPGQQARVRDARKIAVAKVDTENVMAWRNGIFNFEGVALKEVMDELSRWYNVEVVYEKGVPDIHFFGELSRSLPLTDIVKALEDSKVHIRMEGTSRMVVLP